MPPEQIGRARAAAGEERSAAAIADDLETTSALGVFHVDGRAAGLDRVLKVAAAGDEMPAVAGAAAHLDALPDEVAHGHVANGEVAAALRKAHAVAAEILDECRAHKIRPPRDG